MINSTLRRTAFAAAVAAVLPLPAAAQSDAAFAAALGKIPAGLAATAQLKARPQIPAAAQVQGPIAPADIWTKVLDKVRRDGEKGADSGFLTQSLTASTGDPKLDYAVHSIIVFHFVDANANFKVVGAELSMESSTLESGTIRTDYWTMIVKASGKVDSAVYNQRVDVPGTQPVVSAPAVVDLTDPRVKARFDEMLEFWSTRS